MEEYLQKKGDKLVVRAPMPLSNGYRPEIDLSPELEELDTAYYHSLIGVLWWIVEIERVDICTKVLMMSSHLALPCEGHLSEVLHIFSYLKKHHNSEMVIDPTTPVIDGNLFIKQDWVHSLYGCEELVEELPDRMPTQIGRMMRVYIDSDHAGDTLTH